MQLISKLKKNIINTLIIVNTNYKFHYDLNELDSIPFLTQRSK